MGRQGYLAKLAFGRSAFEPTQEAAQSDEFIQLDSSQADLPQRYHNFDGNNYVQLYDERGNPMNPRAREYGKKLRNAQNDVLAAVGVVERRASPAEGLPGSYQDRLDLLDVEDTVGDAIEATLTITENVCTWWIGTIRNRVLTFRYHDTMPFARIVAFEHRVSGNSIFYTSFVPVIFATMVSQTIVYNALVYQPVARLMQLTYASRKTRKLYRWSRDALKFGLRVGLEVLFFPFFYHAELQRLGLVAARPFLPSLRSLVPFSAASPTVPFSLYYDPTKSVLDFLGATLTSPLALVCAGHFFERWVYGALNEAIDSSVIRPDHPDIATPEADTKHRVTTILGLRRQSPPLIRKAINGLLSTLGWAAPYYEPGTVEPHSPVAARPDPLTEGQTIEVGGTTVANITPLELAVAQQEGQGAVEILDVESPAMQAAVADGSERPRSPTTPLVADMRHDDDDPRIRITNREGIVEMEVRLPPRIISSQTELADAVIPPRDSQLPRLQHEALSSTNVPHHRVSELSLESSRMVSTMVKTQLIGIVMLPVKVVVLRLIASHYLASHSSTGSPRAVLPLPDFKDLSWRSVGVQLSRLALCNALEIAIDLSIWSVQYALSVNIGKSRFGWGTL